MIINDLEAAEKLLKEYDPITKNIRLLITQV